MKKSERTKEDMIRAVIKLIEETGGIDFSIGEIAKRAEVAVGLINYHYASKQALIVEAVARCIEEQIVKDNIYMLNENFSPRELLLSSLQSYADFLVNHDVISRLHIKFSLDGSMNYDVLAGAIAYYLPIIHDMNSSLNTEQIVTALTMIVSTLQMTFLQEAATKQTIKVDFYQKKERDTFIEHMVLLTIG